ncbi:hypothetical protein M758_UG014700 [Ceratodon purpureus]|nr:hypothetical protein M758_UG014700 [Ceratodon purpureus]
MRKGDDCLGGDGEHSPEVKMPRRMINGMFWEELHPPTEGDNTRGGAPKGTAGSSQTAMEILSPEDKEDVEEESWYHAMQRKYKEHVVEYNNDPYPDYFKLTWEEFCCQQKIDKDEFGPNDTPVSIMRDFLDLLWHEKECTKEWRLRAHRFHKVRKLKQMKEKSSEALLQRRRRTLTVGFTLVEDEPP